MGSRPAGERRPRLVANELPFSHADPFRIGELEGRIAAVDEVSAEVGVAGGLPGVLADQIDAPAHAICAARTPLWQTRSLNRITPPGSIGSATGKPGGNSFSGMPPGSPRAGARHSGGCRESSAGSPCRGRPGSNVRNQFLPRKLTCEVQRASRLNRRRAYLRRNMVCCCRME